MIQPAQRKPASPIRWLVIVAVGFLLGSLVVSTYSNHLFFKGIPIRALAPDRTPSIPVKWQFTGAGAISAALALGADGTLYAPSEDGFLYALDPSGNLQWKFDAGAITAAPVIGADGTNTTTNSGRMSINLKPLDKRDVNASDLIRRLKPALRKIQGIELFMQPIQDITVDDRVSRMQYQYTLEDSDAGELDKLGLVPMR